jgi:hypothetical protein
MTLYFRQDLTSFSHFRQWKRPNPESPRVGGGKISRLGWTSGKELLRVAARKQFKLQDFADYADFRTEAGAVGRPGEASFFLLLPLSSLSA